MDELQAILSSLEELRYIFIGLIDMKMEPDVKMAVLKQINGWSDAIDNAECSVDFINKSLDRLISKLNSRGIDL